MNKKPVLSDLKKRLRQFKHHGYDLPASRRFVWKVSGIREEKVLEIGTGKGHLTALLAKKGLLPVSIDLDPEPLRIAGRHLKELGLHKRATLRAMNAERLVFASHSIDHVISADFFHHAKDPVRCLREMMRVARTTIVIADLNARGMRILDRIHRKEGKKHETPVIPFRKLGRNLRKNGFTVKSYRHPCHEIFVAQRRSP